MSGSIDVSAQPSAPDLWRQYQETGGDPEVRNQLVLQYSPLVKYVAGRVRAELPANVDSADLVSEGVFGLMDAIDKFEPDRGLQFQTYAVPRIRGAIMDSIRAADWVPRSVRSQLRTLDQAAERLRLQLGRTPTDEEIAAEAGMSLAELRTARGKSTSVSSAADEELAQVGDLAPRLDEMFEADDSRDELLQALARLPERDRIIMALYFFEGFTLGEIGLILDVTESRISQLRTRAMAALRGHLADVMREDA
ncbi:MULTISPECIES: FliA/WhiG family RNA polymerase sigma factor [Nocardioides]|uniref:FliA/WhiG family RNA polymerase sigma factor n=1 Tax=Nocardioides TaxID=1839 RepID=UPI002867B6F0|nr:FliA/WhiG family RNA polymerase sigma factor [Nocardioides sp. CGMCC 1.13656]